MNANKFWISALAFILVSTGALATSITVGPNPNKKPPVVPVRKAPPKRPPAKRPPAPIVQPPAPQRSATELDEDIKTIDDALSSVAGDLDGRFFYSFKIAPKSVSAKQTVESCKDSGIDLAKLSAFLPDASKPIAGIITLQRQPNSSTFPGKIVVTSPKELSHGVVNYDSASSKATLHALQSFKRDDSPEDAAEKTIVEFGATLTGIEPVSSDDPKAIFKFDSSHVLSDAKMTVYAFAKKDDDAPSCVLIATLIPGQTISLKAEAKPDTVETAPHDVKINAPSSTTDDKPAEEPKSPEALVEDKKNVRIPAEPTAPAQAPASTVVTRLSGAATAAPTATAQGSVLKAMSGPSGGCAVDGSQGWLLVMTAFGLISIRRRRVS